MIQKNFRFSGEEGFHARPVSEFVEVAKRFESRIEIEFDGEVYEGKSPLSIMCGCIEDGCVFTLKIDGPDEQAAYEALYHRMALSPDRYFVEVQEESGPSAQAEKKAAGGDSDNPGAAIPLSGGIAIGKTMVYRRGEREYEKKAQDINAETDKLFAAIEAVLQKLCRMEEETSDQNAAGILKAHREIISDQSFIESIREKIAAEGFSSIYSIHLVAEEVRARFEALKNDRMRERAADVKDVSNQLIDEIMGGSQSLEVQEPGTVVVADELLPSDTIHLDPSKVAGFITEKGGKNCHSAIVARSLGIPAISNVVGALESIPDGAPIVLDGDKGLYFLFPDEKIQKEYREKLNRNEEEKEKDKAYLSGPSRTIDGRELELSANIFSGAEMQNAASLGAEGVGLFRTEFLYMNRSDPPPLEEQFACYKTLLEQAENLPVTIRTLDAGGDKPTPCLQMPREENPFLGVRAIRFCLRNEEIFRTQLRALLMASAYGRLRMMFPMISTVEELLRALSLLQEEREKLEKEGVKLGEYQVGVMIETPAAAVMSVELAKLVDFFSIGSNDLNQYVMAADRTSGELSEFHSAYQPAVLRLIYHVVKAAEQNGIWVGVCGESGGDPLLVPLYLGMGITELSMSAPRIAATRRIISNLRFDEMKGKVDAILSAATERELKSLLEGLYDREH